MNDRDATCSQSIADIRIFDDVFSSVAVFVSALKTGTDENSIQARRTTGRRESLRSRSLSREARARINFVRRSLTRHYFCTTVSSLLSHTVYRILESHNVCNAATEREEERERERVPGITMRIFRYRGNCLSGYF